MCPVAIGVARRDVVLADDAVLPEPVEEVARADQLVVAVAGLPALAGLADAVPGGWRGVIDAMAIGRVAVPVLEVVLIREARMLGPDPGVDDADDDILAGQPGIGPQAAVRVVQTEERAAVVGGLVVQAVRRDRGHARGVEQLRGLLAGQDGREAVDGIGVAVDLLGLGGADRGEQVILALPGVLDVALDLGAVRIELGAAGRLGRRVARRCRRGTRRPADRAAVRCRRCPVPPGRSDAGAAVRPRPPGPAGSRARAQRPRTGQGTSASRHPPWAGLGPANERVEPATWGLGEPSGHGSAPSQTAVSRGRARWVSLGALPAPENGQGSLSTSSRTAAAEASKAACSAGSR